MPWAYKLTVLALVYMFTNPCAYTPHPFLPQLSWMDSDRAWQEGAPRGALPALHSELFRVLLRDAPLQHPPLHEQHTHGGTRHTDSMRID